MVENEVSYSVVSKKNLVKKKFLYKLYVITFNQTITQQTFNKL